PGSVLANPVVHALVRYDLPAVRVHRLPKLIPGQENALLLHGAPILSPFICFCNPDFNFIVTRYGTQVNGHFSILNFPKLLQCGAASYIIIMMCARSLEDKVFDSDSKDRGFESRRARH